MLRKVFSLDVLACPQCVGRMELIAFIADAGVAKRILDHLGLVSIGPPVAKTCAPDKALDPGPDCGGADPNSDDWGGLQDGQGPRLPIGCRREAKGDPCGASGRRGNVLGWLKWALILWTRVTMRHIVGSERRVE